MARTDSRSKSFSSRLARGTACAALALGALALTRVAAGLVQEPPGGVPTIVVGGQAMTTFAVPECLARRGDEASREACRTITQVLRADLDFEKLFRFVSDNLYSVVPPISGETPNFEDWKSVGASVLVVMRAEVVSGQLALDVKVWSVDAGASMLAKRYGGKADNPRVFAHQASDDILTLTQYRGVARSKIAFVSDRDAGELRRGKELYVMDYDGWNARRVTVNGALNILPTWSPDGRSLAYVSYRGGSPDVYRAHIFEGRSENLTKGGGAQAFAPAFSPDGTRLAYASNRSGNMEVWSAAADGSGARRLTSSSASDTAPCWSPTGQEIAFTSSRSGTPQIWVMDSEGLNVRRLTTIGNYNDAPAWNPSKQWSELAYTSRIEGGFEIAVLDLATRQVRQITEGRGSCEYPSWAPSGRHLVFSCKRGGTWQVTLADRMGVHVRTLAAGPGNNVQPDWGP